MPRMFCVKHSITPTAKSRTSCEIEEANVRQVVSRARKHIGDGQCRFVGSDEQRRFLETFIGAAPDGLEALFAEDVASYSDGGGRMRAGAGSDFW
jgi:hypothetical protein